MAEYSKMPEIGTKMHKFKLADPDGVLHGPETVAGDRGVVVMFICNHCPFVVHVAPELTKVANHYRDKGVGFIAVNSNDITTHPQDSPDKMRVFAKEHHFPFPYVFDATQEVARAYQAACTPDFFVYDEKFRLFYRGRLDESTPGNDKPLTGKELRAALDALTSGDTPPLNQMPSMGCGIKWKKGNEPK